MRLSKRILTVALTLIMLLSSVFTLTSCGDGTKDISGNAYVSVYVYNNIGRRLFYVDAVRVEPNETHDKEWGKTKSAFLALETACISKRKNYEIATDATGNVYVQMINNYNAGIDDIGDTFYWTVLVNGKEVDDITNYELANYDLVEFRYTEQMYRTLDLTYSAANGATLLISDEKASVSGDKNDLTVKYMLTYSDAEKKIESITKTQNITISEDGKSIESIGDVKAEGTFKWVVLVNEEVIDTTIDEFVLKDGDEIRFDYREVKEDEAGGADTGATDVTDAVTAE